MEGTVIMLSAGEFGDRLLLTMLSIEKPRQQRLKRGCVENG
jgi:hypothetical protein